MFSDSRKAKVGVRASKLTLATPRFSIDGILWPICLEDDINGAHFLKV